MRSVTSRYRGSTKPTTPGTARRTAKNDTKLSPEDEVDSGEYIPRRKASRYISSAMNRP